MKDYLYHNLLCHVGHNVQLVTYGADDNEPENVSIECLDCCEVLVSVDKECSDEQDTE